MNYKAASYGLAVAALLGQPLKADDYLEGCRGSGYDPYPRLYSVRPEQREQSVPTAYSTMMQHYYDAVWSEPKPQPTPQVIVIHER
jgi:hypothetical protein